MDFSSDVLIDFGLNLAGYIVVALLLYVLMGRRRREKQPKTVEHAAATSPSPKVVSQPTKAAAPVRVEGPEFIPLAERVPRGRSGAAVSHVYGGDDEAAVPLTEATRKENRRAIYQEARRLLAMGKARRDLLDQLPLTEGELEMLSVAGKA
jgi:hypothetical protein